SHLVNLLGVSANDAADVHRRIRKHRALTVVATASVGGFLLLGATKLPSSTPAPKVHTTAATSIQSVHPSSTTVTTLTTLTADALPPETPPPSSHAPSPTSSDDIGNALVIERGQQPDD